VEVVQYIMGIKIARMVKNYTCFVSSYFDGCPFKTGCGGKVAALVVPPGCVDELAVFLDLPTRKRNMDLCFVAPSWYIEIDEPTEDMLSRVNFMVLSGIL